ncbi:hypothetical protein GE09DRAFT_546690 [Coniochaeta sp. 2T2.1]|nr:hypothetical protein GE09DRAFT_546690 [Coniochaeta sp. 2T2.1]
MARPSPLVPADGTGARPGRSMGCQSPKKDQQADGQPSIRLAKQSLSCAGLQLVRRCSRGNVRHRSHPANNNVVAETAGTTPRISVPVGLVRGARSCGGVRSGCFSGRSEERARRAPHWARGKVQRLRTGQSAIRSRWQEMLKFGEVRTKFTTNGSPPTPAVRLTQGNPLRCQSVRERRSHTRRRGDRRCRKVVRTYRRWR